jgi:hypothetical protein
MKKILWAGLTLAVFVLIIIFSNLHSGNDELKTAVNFAEKNISILFSFAAIIISIIALAVNNRYTKIAIRQSQRTDYSAMEFEINKLRVDRPELFDIYDNPPLPGTKDDSAEAMRRRFAYILLYFSCFDKVFHFYNHDIPMTKTDISAWKAWEKTMEDLFKNSSQARSAFHKIPEGLYPDKFRDFIIDMIKKAEKEKKSMNK